MALVDGEAAVWANLQSLKWELPDSHLEAQKDLGYQGYHIEIVDTLNPSRYENQPKPPGVDTLNPPPPRKEVVSG